MIIHIAALFNFLPWALNALQKLYAASRIVRCQLN